MIAVHFFSNFLEAPTRTYVIGYVDGLAVHTIRTLRELHVFDIYTPVNFKIQLQDNWWCKMTHTFPI